MRIKILSLLIVSIFFSFSTTDWEVFQSFDGKFKILTPGKMEKKEKSIETGIGNISYITHFHQPAEKDADNLVYMVSYCDYPENSIHSDSTAFLEEFFKTTIESSVESVNGELSYTTEIELGDYSGKLWRVDYNDGKASIKTKAYMVKNRLFTLQVITMKDKAMNIWADKFLDSFSLLSSDG